MIDDAEKAHQVLVDTYDLNRQSFPSYKTKGLKDKNNPLNAINTLHKFFKKFIAHHGSYDREEIQDWCNLFSFMYNHNGIMSLMVIDFFKTSYFNRKSNEIQRSNAKKVLKFKLFHHACANQYFFN